jgi:microsomal dipeptidase-like Zn-dependent dipeptidase
MIRGSSSPFEGKAGVDDFAACLAFGQYSIATMPRLLEFCCKALRGNFRLASDAHLFITIRAKTYTRGTYEQRCIIDAPTPRVPLGGDYWQVDPGTELWGFADLHAHLMAHLTFGGNAFWGQPYDPEHTGDAAMEHVLGSCEPIHGGLININPEIGHPVGGGWPDFVIWPRFTTLVHQQAYVDWNYLAYQGGHPLITCLAVNNEQHGTRSNPQLPTDDRSAIERQVIAMKQMIVDLDRQAGGPGQSWMQIAYSAEEARAIIKANKLAIVFGVEVDSLGNWRRMEDLQKACGDDLDRAREVIGAELDWLHGLGVRQITPIHLTDNAFGGTAIYMRLLDILNIFVTGRHYNVENGWDSGIRYRIDRDGTDVVDDAQRAVIASGDSISPVPTMTRQALIRQVPAVRDLFEALESPEVGGGHANARGLSDFGVILLQEMMRRGMLIDIDHMSQKSTDAALDLAERHAYPVVSSHAWFRDLAFSADVEFDQMIHSTMARTMSTRWRTKWANAPIKWSASDGWAASSRQSSIKVTCWILATSSAPGPQSAQVLRRFQHGLGLSFVCCGKNGWARCRHRQRCEWRGSLAGPRFAPLRPTARTAIAIACRCAALRSMRRKTVSVTRRLSGIIAGIALMRAGRKHTIAKSVKRGRLSRSTWRASIPIGISIPRMMRRQSR